MTTSSPWPTIHDERRALVDDLEPLTEEQWSTPSLCERWTVRDVFAHMTATEKMTPPKFVGKLVGSGFRINTMFEKDIAREEEGTPAEALDEFRAHMGDSTHPPGPIDAMLGEMIVHGEDIRRPLGIAHDYPMDAVVRVADFYKNSNLLIGSKSRVAGLTLRATDTDWTTGSGPEVSGPMLALVLAMTGRSAALGELGGDGLGQLKSALSK
ncbi:MULTISPECIES: maleylpyruvate isomerase family mycothiol-dependent enzyme [unclassified Rhodococcus (in: high G+C Gram-positive bacteria)]|uniref:maleylpyruvate isomerase family mycothiol-dependent enzyme n=1 Tax=unclassified Rhodococcus (in: high G+C Gram-positive bacteria) TaxID=192944 RepID=UPI00163A1C39|nr:MULTISPECIES: maleylpyruvate isomerase family mycothiol-dependent enzyme [unclassified Rhodococcus (in: high G+C Gram-positive bacteria)]MBC2641463.1 maleylpyruvate isomerase family mycothiol-dependent enzyme [Rhodococcus sp. 3A]MBC2893792.1 maleylpyruvate isomerase family mycothiol-dependent enzyme [Rhodococcus sp. 4CII]